MPKEQLEELNERCRTAFDFPRIGDTPLPSYPDPDLPMVKMSTPSEDAISDDGAEG